MKATHLFGMVCAACASLLLFSCTDPEPEEPQKVEVTSVTLTPSELTLDEGKTASLTATVQPANATDKSVSWSSDKQDVASVDNQGLVTAVKAGTATITARSGNGKTATCAVTVKALVVAVTKLEWETSATSIEVGKESAFKVTVLPENATDKTVTWSSSAPAVASVTSTGTNSANVKGLSAGSTVITASCGGKSITCNVTVAAPNVPVTGLEWVQSTPTLRIGEKISFGVKVLPENATDQAITWTSETKDIVGIQQMQSDPKYANITGLHTGSTVITVSCGGKSITKTVKVTASYTVMAGGSPVGYGAIVDYTLGSNTNDLVPFQLKNLFTEEIVNLTDANLFVKIAHDSIASLKSIDAQQFSLKAKKAGTTKVSIYVDKSYLIQDYYLSVKSGITSVSITSKTLTNNEWVEDGALHLTQGETFALTTKVTGNANADQSIEWSSDEVSFVTVSSSGQVRAVAPRLAGSYVYSSRVWAKCKADPSIKDYIDVFVYSKPTSITCTTTTNDIEGKFIKPKDSRTLAFRIQPETARQQLVAMKTPGSVGGNAWTCTVDKKNLKATVTCPALPSSFDDRKALYENAYSFLFAPIGAKTLTTQVNMYPCEFYATDVKPMDYVYYNSSTKKLRSSDGGLRTLRYSPYKIYIAAAPTANEKTVAVITYIGDIGSADSFAKNGGVLTGLSNAPSTHGFAIAMNLAATNVRWSDDTDDVNNRSQWPSAYPKPGSTTTSKNWKKAFAFTQGGLRYNEESGNSHDIKPITAIADYAKKNPVGTTTGDKYDVSHWVVPTATMDWLIDPESGSNSAGELSVYTDVYRNYINPNITNAGGAALDKAAKYWSINTPGDTEANRKANAYLVSRNLYSWEKKSDRDVRAWLVF